MPDDDTAWPGVVCLPENRSALVAAGRVVARLTAAGKSPDDGTPLLLHGPAGTGKTLIVGAMLRRVAELPGGLTARAVAARELPRRRADDPDGEAATAFAELLALDFVAVEDVQHLPVRSVAALAELIDHRASRRRVTVLTASAGPANLGKFPRRLTSRLAAGLVVQVEPLGRAARGSLLTHKAGELGVALADSGVAALLDLTAGGGVRPMLGVLATLKALAGTAKRPADALDASTVKLLLRNGHLELASSPMTRLLERVAATYAIPVQELLGRSRRADALIPRQVAMYLARETTALSLPKIGAALGGRDHTTVLHAWRKVAALAVTDDRLARTLRELTAELQ